MTPVRVKRRLVDDPDVGTRTYVGSLVEHDDGTVTVYCCDPTHYDRLVLSPPSGQPKPASQDYGSAADIASDGWEIEP